MSDGPSAEVSNYNGLIAAINNASVNTIELNDSITSAGVISISRSLTLDLNGQTLALSGANRIEVGAGGDLTITDSSTDPTNVGTIVYTVAKDENSAIKVAGTDDSNKAKLTLEKCSIIVNSNDNDNGYGVFAAGYCEITSGNTNASNGDVKITAGYSAISGNEQYPNVNLKINSGTYESTNSAAVYFPCNGTLTVTGGTFTGKTGFDIRAGTVNISDATINATGSYDEIANTSNPSRTDLPTVWGMGIAVIDHPSYSKTTSMSVTLSDLTFTGNTKCDLYIGDFNRKTGDDAGRFNSDNLDESFTVNKTIKVAVTDVLEYSVTKSTDTTSGYLIIDDLNTSDKTFTVTNLFNKGDAAVENNGTIIVNDLDGLRSAAAIGDNIQLGNDILIEKMEEALEIVGGAQGNPTLLDLKDHTITINMIGKSGSEITNQSKYSESGNLKANANRLVVADGAEVTIKNGTIKYTEDADVTGTYKVKSPIKVGGGSSESKLILENVSIDSNEYGVCVFKNGTLEVKNSDNYTIHGDVSAISTNGSADSSPLTSNGAKIKLNGGNYTSESEAAIYFPGGESLTVTGGTFTGATGFDIRAGKISISGAKITANGNTNANFSAANGASGWGMGIAVFDHSSYAKNNSTIDVTIKNVTFKSCTTCNIFVGKHPGDGKTGDVSFSDIENSNPAHAINVTINDVDFETKGLYINGANDVTIQNCVFNTITDTLNNSHYAAIAVINYSGNIVITNNQINDVKVISDGDQNAAGIKLQQKSNLPAAPGSITITGNTIKNVDWNAINFTNNLCSAGTVTISNNIFEEWDANNDGCNPDVNCGGRALRLSFVNGSSSNVVISENIFIKKYNENAEFVNKIETDSSNNAYDDGNILKVTGHNTEFKDNVLRLTGITDYSGDKLFKFDDGEYFMVTFDANMGHFLDDSKNTKLCSLFAALDGSATIVKPDDSLIDRSGSYKFDGWYSDSSLTTPFTDFTTPITENKTLYAKWTPTGTSGGIVVPPVVPDVPDEPTIVPDENNNVNVPEINEEKTDELIHEAVSSGSNSITIIDTSDVKGDYSAVTVSKADLETIAKSIENNNNIDSVSIPTSEGNIIIEKEVLSSILESTNADSVSFGVEDAKDKLTEEQKKAVGDRPVYDINIKAGNENVTSFNGKTITISLPYTLKAGEDPENIVVYYVRDDGSLEKMNCEFKDGKVVFETDHLSKYVIAYEESEEPIVPDKPEDDKKDDSSNNTIYYAVAAVIIVLIIIALAYYFMKKKQ